MDFNDLIGLDILSAKKVLQDFGYNDIEEVVNSKNNEQCNVLVVCAVKENGSKITLVCGEFFLI